MPPASRSKQVILGLQCKATVFVVAVALTVSLAASLFLFGASTNLFESQHAEETLRLAETVALAAAPLLETSDRPNLKELARELTTRDPVLCVRFYDRDGSPLVSHSRPGQWLPDVTIPWQLGAADFPMGVSQFYPAQRDHPAFAGVVYPVRDLTSVVGGQASGGPGGVLGYVHLATSVESWHLWSRQTVNFLTGIGMIVLLLGIPLSYLVVRRMVRPIHELCQVMAAFSSGYLDVRSRVERRDELGMLAGAFNVMADQHQRAHESLLKLNTELEKRVARRTRLLRHLATRDSLTGLYNRRYFDEMLKRRFAEADRYGHVLACLMIDVDDFKSINDTCGHTEGDRQLMTLAGVIRRQMRVSDVGARFGGDEFVILLPHTDREQARTLARRICTEFAELQARQERTPATTLSIGLADTIGLEPKEPGRLLQAADQALYAAKGSGKNCMIAAAPSLQQA